jgi:hypothetical protein
MGDLFETEPQAEQSFNFKAQKYLSWLQADYIACQQLGSQYLSSMGLNLQQKVNVANHLKETLEEMKEDIDLLIASLQINDL